MVGVTESLQSLLIQIDHAAQQAARAYFAGRTDEHHRWRDRCQFLNNAIAAFLRAEEER